MLFLGLFVAQIIATIQVYATNIHLHSALVAIIEAGYFPLPNEGFMHKLLELGPAILGGLFFTLSIGAGLTFVSMAAGHFWVRLFRRKKISLVPCLILWLGAVLAVNYHGFCPIVTLYFLMIPAVVFTATVKWNPDQAAQKSSLTRIIHIISPFLLALLWATQTNGPLFLEFRDNLLLSNSWGTKINDFYYANTLYPAEVFKPLDQKILKTADLGKIGKKPVARATERELINYDYINVEGKDKVDLKIREEGNSFLFLNGRKPILRTSLQEFLSEPERVLKDFSLKSDRYGFFRKFTWYSLLIGLPLTLYVIAHALFCVIIYPFFGFRISSIVASMICFLLGFSLWVSFVNLRGERIEIKDLPAALDSESWRKRVSALKTIVQSKLEISDFPNYQRFMTSVHVPERFWLVAALGVSRRPKTWHEIFPFLDDPHPNVQRMALHALGQRGNRAAIPEIENRIETSDHYFSQWYAYKALRALGWKQVKKSP
jgi:Ca2+/Na+ antiporter